MKRLALFPIFLCAALGLWGFISGTNTFQQESLAAEPSASGPPAAPDEFACLTGSFFQNSLHFTTQGMRYWYDAEDGFGKITGMPYEQTGCASCHVKNCDSCHADKAESGPMMFTVAKARDMNTCLPCHSREKASMGIDEKAGTPDVHFAAGNQCADCHTAREVHGSGVLPNSMRDVGYMETSCTGCHAEGGKGPTYDMTTASHTIHGDKLDCAACHVTNTMACYNCHFTKFMETGVKEGNFVPNKEWMLLINYNGKVTSGTVMTLVDKNKTFATFGPYFTHSIMKTGRKCADCHANEAVTTMQDGKKVPLVKFQDGKLVFWKGMIPVVNDKIELLFLDKDADGNWIPLEGAEPPLIQYSCYGTPLTDEQLTMLAMPMG